MTWNVFFLFSIKKPFESNILFPTSISQWSANGEQSINSNDFMTWNVFSIFRVLLVYELLVPDVF